MKLNRRVQLLILPVIFTSFVTIATGLYLVERNSIYRLNQNSVELEATELAGSFNQYSLVIQGLLASLLQSDALRHFLDSNDERFKSLALSSSLDVVLNTFSSVSTDKFSITFIRGDGTEEYYYENSLDPFSSPEPHLAEWAKELIKKRIESSSRYFQDRDQIAYCNILNRLTLKTPLEFSTTETLLIIISLKPSEFIKHRDELQKAGRSLDIHDNNTPLPALPQFSARRPLPGFGSLDLEVDQKIVKSSLMEMFRRLAFSFLILIILTYIVLQWLLRRYVIKPINDLEQQLARVDLDATGELTVYNSKDEIGNLSQTFARLYDKLKETYEGTRELAERDSLTTLYNRRIFNITLQKLLGRAKNSNSNVALLYIDIDNFKFVNDHHGHATGDSLLKTFALRLHDVVRGGDIVFKNYGVSSTTARLAGDEFAVIIHGYCEEDAPAKVARRIQKLCDNGFVSEDGYFPISLSIGVATFPKDGNTADEMIINADSAMYLSKKRGKNTISFFSEELGENARRQQTLEVHLKQLDFSELEINYMPIVDARTSRIYSLEALLRWNSRQLGAVSPAEFIPLAESMGVYQRIDLWVIERTFIESQAIRQHFGDGIRISINISAAELSQHDFVEKVVLLGETCKIDPAMFTVEITETFYKENTTVTPDLLQTLRQAGFQLAIDDLGSGYSSLLQLVEFPISMVKIDRTFIDKSLASNNHNILKSLVEFCHVQKLSVTAEGVENEQEATILRQAGCDYLQGFYFARPMPVRDLPELAAILSN